MPDKRHCVNITSWKFQIAIVVLLVRKWFIGFLCVLSIPRKLDKIGIPTTLYMWELFLIDILPLAILFTCVF